MMRFSTIVACAFVLLLSACASDVPYETFSNDRSRDALLQLIPVGTPIAEAEARMEKNGYSCGTGHGVFRADDRVNEAPAFLVCQSTSRSYLPMFMFDTHHRWTAYFIDVNGKVSDVIVDMDTVSLAG